VKLIVADVYGEGYLVDKDGTPEPLSSTKWAEADMRDTVVTNGSQTATVRYRQDGVELELGPDSVYQIEGIENPDVVDVRSYWDDMAKEIREVIDAGNEERLVALLRRAARREPHVPDVLEVAFFALTGRTLRDAIDQAEWIWRKDALQYVD
jgi:hypothetical protein